MSTVSLKVQKEMDLEDFKDHMVWAGGFDWPWWNEILVGEDGLAVSYYEDADDTDTSPVTKKFLTWQELADACSELASTHPLVAEQLVNDDFDAIGSDCVLQYAYIGEIRYG